MSDLPNVTGKQALAVFLSLGWRVDRISGSHHILYKEGSAPFPIAVKANRDLNPGTLRAMIRQAGITVDEFVKALECL